MKKIILLLFTLSIIISIGGCTKKISKINETTNPEIGENKEVNNNIKENGEIAEETIYRNKKEGFSMLLPDKWTFQEDTYGFLVVLFTPKKEGDVINENLGVMIDDNKDKKNMDDYYKSFKENTKNRIKDIQEIQEKEIKINGLKGKEIVYAGSLGNFKLKWKQIIIEKNNKFFIMTYTATEDTFDNYIKNIDKIINSFEF